MTGDSAIVGGNIGPLDLQTFREIHEGYFG